MIFGASDFSFSEHYDTVNPLRAVVKAAEKLMERIDQSQNKGRPDNDPDLCSWGEYHELRIALLKIPK